MELEYPIFLNGCHIILLDMCLNGNRSCCSFTKVFNGIYVEKFHFGTDVSAFFSGISVSKRGIQLKTNLITFDPKSKVCRSFTIVL